MDQKETLAWIADLLPGSPQVKTYTAGQSALPVNVATVVVGSDVEGHEGNAETVAMTLNASQIDPQLETEDGSDLRVELLTITTGKGSTAAELLAAAVTTIAQNPHVHSPQPGTFLPNLGDHIQQKITAKHGLLLAPYVWEEGVPHVHEVASSGKRGKNKTGEHIEFTHPGRLTVPAQLVMLTDAEFELATTSGLNAVQEHIAKKGVNLNDVWRVSGEL
ncbi:suppressor of fused domain protein [Corynebacterium anserum]|uniref:Uncharacterized protein n=1 Tax=Corynebacterium anserum TaxID=2684406 RepID=A0A7G7YQH6_9CORY|nr:suppressor of fused domain protein [Corynebacterium anserum]MBC2682432.1 hypothetical protein [Corynebacterium anserum]QNH96746.1 hypothetical protein GP473_08860 [Corynebacterium anserum]